MILSDIKRYLETRGQASLNELALHFDVDPDAMRGMLARWIDKGKVARTVAPGGCRKGCRSCGCGNDLEIYAWQA